MALASYWLVGANAEGGRRFQRRRGGKVYGQWPGLGREQLFEGRDLALSTDFRDVLAEVLVHHLGATALSAVFPGYDARPEKFRRFLRT